MKTTTTTTTTFQTLKLEATTRDINGVACIELATTARKQDGGEFTYYRHHAFINQKDKQEQGEIMYLITRQAIIIDKDPESTRNGYNIHKLMSSLIDNGYISEKLGSSINLD